MYPILRISITISFYTTMVNFHANKKWTCIPCRICQRNLVTKVRTAKKIFLPNRVTGGWTAKQMDARTMFHRWANWPRNLFLKLPLLNYFLQINQASFYASRHISYIHVSICSFASMHWNSSHEGNSIYFRFLPKYNLE